MAARRSVNDLVAEAKGRIEELSVAELQAEIEAGDVTVIDIRDVRERWDKGAIPGAKSMPRGEPPGDTMTGSPVSNGSAFSGPSKV